MAFRGLQDLKENITLIDEATNTVLYFINDRMKTRFYKAQKQRSRLVNHRRITVDDYMRLRCELGAEIK